MNTREITGVRLRLLRGDITDQEADAIVNAANSSLMGGGGVDGAIHRRGGAAILEACKHHRKQRYPEGLPSGEAVTTTGGNLNAGAVIHTVGPVWQGGSAGEAAVLARGYRNALEEARLHGFRIIAFPSISTGAYGYPVEKAAPIALRTVAEQVEAHLEAFKEIRFVLFSERDLQMYQQALAQLEQALP